jgi:hypothetical protein
MRINNGTLPKLDTPYENSGEMKTFLDQLGRKKRNYKRGYITRPKILSGLNATQAYVSHELLNSTEENWVKLNQGNKLVWAPNHPNRNVGPCVSGVNGKLVSSLCNAGAPFVCEVYGTTILHFSS